MSITGLSKSTGVTPDQWKELLSLFGRSKSASYEHVTTDEQALAMVVYLSHAGDRLGKRIVLAWHVLRYLVGPKVDFLATAKKSTSAHDDLDDVIMLTREDKCQRLVEKLSGVPYKALDMLEGKDVVPVETISDVTRLMGEFQDAASLVFKGGVKLGDAVANDRATAKASTTAASRRVALTLLRQWSKASAVAAHNFPQLWLRRLRAWHALPPLMQALLPIMASMVNVESPATFFRLPYYDVRAPPTYNFAALGQIIAQAMAREFIERRRVDAAESERLRRFWDKGDHATGGSLYCLFTRYNKNGTTRRRIRLNESDLSNGMHLGELLGSRIAHLAFRRARHSKASGRGQVAWTLPGVLLASKQLFFVMHCALSCAMGGNHDSPYSPSGQGCMVMYKTQKRFIDAPCGMVSTKRVPHECHHL
ncbi:hypothetical protein HPB50_008751 [Hyalomma asiaticum]|uniref:Uncharacterized protein n=1 Tax=Hyalomma asiaticum TaxID=266040 RepID=A0ACB7T943_HYAAI|nr:hypothetical protein HPB50_008751 [Hyalomma asiaticum]